MTRRPDEDETIVLGERSGWAGGERFYLKEVAVFLHQSAKSVRKWARRQRLIKRIRMRIVGGGSDYVEYFTRYSAMRVIAHFRLVQGELHLRGKDYHRKKDMDRAWQLRQKAKLSK